MKWRKIIRDVAVRFFLDQFLNFDYCKQRNPKCNCANIGRHWRSDFYINSQAPHDWLVSVVDRLRDNLVLYQAFLNEDCWRMQQIAGKFTDKFDIRVIICHWNFSIIVLHAYSDWPFNTERIKMFFILLFDAHFNMVRLNFALLSGWQESGIV